MSEHGETVSITAAARRLGVHRTTITRWITEGRIAYVGIGSLRRIRITEINRLTRDVPATDTPETTP